MTAMKDSYTISDCPAWTINGILFNMIDPSTSEKYLGLYMQTHGLGYQNLNRQKS